MVSFLEVPPFPGCLPAFNPIVVPVQGPTGGKRLFHSNAQILLRCAFVPKRQVWHKKALFLPGNIHHHWTNDARKHHDDHLHMKHQIGWNRISVKCLATWVPATAHLPYFDLFSTCVRAVWDFKLVSQLGQGLEAFLQLTSKLISHSADNDQATAAAIPIYFRDVDVTTDSLDHQTTWLRAFQYTLHANQVLSKPFHHHLQPLL